MDIGFGVDLEPVSHFTWMDIEFSGRARRAKGYPVEIQMMWIRLLRLSVGQGKSAKTEQKRWSELADHAMASFEKLFWLERLQDGSRMC